MRTLSTQDEVAVHHDYVCSLVADSLSFATMAARFSTGKQLCVGRDLPKKYHHRCIPDEVKNYVGSAAFRAAEPATLAKLSDYADFIKAQVDASLGQDKLCRKLWHDH